MTTRLSPAQVDAFRRLRVDLPYAQGVASPVTRYDTLEDVFAWLDAYHRHAVPAVERLDERARQRARAGSVLSSLRGALGNAVDEILADDRDHGCECEAEGALRGKHDAGCPAVYWAGRRPS